MSLKIYLITGLIALVTGIVFSFIDIKISFGIAIATLFSLINLFMLQESMKKVISSSGTTYGIMFLVNIVRFTLLFGMIYIAYKFPQYFSMIGVAIGLTLFMFALLIDALNKRKGA